MDDPKPCPETWALHAQAQIAAQAMHLARICRNDSPAGCADASPEVFAAMIQAHAMNRIADALGSLERIATALEAGGAEEPLPDAAKQEPAVKAEPVFEGAWLSGRPGWNDSSRGFVQVREGGRLATLPTGWKFRVKDFWAISPADHWWPLANSVNWSFVEEPASSPTTAPQEPPAGDPDALVLGTSQERHTGGSEAGGQEGPAAAPSGESEKLSMDELLELELPGLERVSSGPPVAAPGGHPLDRDGWIRSRLPAVGDATANGRVKTPHGRGQSWFWISWHVVTPGQPWAPASTEPSPYTPQPLPAHLAYPTSEGWIHDRVPGPEDGDKEGDVFVAGDVFVDWSHIVPGQPWRPIF
jgi:hypothetical protein